MTGDTAELETKESFGKMRVSFLPAGESVREEYSPLHPEWSARVYFWNW